MPYSLLIASILFGVHSGADQASLKHIFNSLYARINERYIAKDVKGMAKFYREDYLYTSIRGTILRRDEFFAESMQLLQPMTKVKDGDTVDRVVMDHGHATVSFHEVFMATRGRNEGKKQLMKQMFAATDVWYPEGHSWRLKSTKLGKVTTYINGRLTSRPAPVPTKKQAR